MASNFYQKWLHDTYDLILTRLHEPTFNVEELATTLSLSRSQLFRRIKELTGQTPSEYIRNIRLERAKALLIEKKCDTVKEVAFEVGFRQTGYFSKMFKKKYDIYPRQLL